MRLECMFYIPYYLKKIKILKKKQKKCSFFSMIACFSGIIVKFGNACACCMDPVSPYFYYLYKAF